ncbi:uncharacterized protein LOC132048953 [Lycium ferocissimum]|uniref:uncharacterized protein LOC132048953 n=1 Tax=Lycium ferocissimum TaxID=112874 RepID=UPI00281590F1|nr:uncharacterized protein LOC132048953 [Lycium ferocissimum]
MESLLELMSKGAYEYQETSGGLPQKIAGVLQVDDVAAIRANITTLINVMLRVFPQAQQQNHSVGNSGNDYGNNYNPPFGKQDFHKLKNYQQPQGQPASNLEEMMKQLIAQTQVTQQQNQKIQSEMQKSIHELERQMGQMAMKQNARPQGAFPSDTEKNPKEFKVVTLRNGRELEEVPPKKKNIAEAELIHAKPAKPEQTVQINIPLVELLQEVPKYAKYIKDVVVNKRRWTEFEIVALTEECSSRVRSKIPPKLKDPCSFMISITISNIEVGLALCDLGASINLMPTSVFRTLGLGEPRPMIITLQLADRSLAYPDSIIEDVLVKVGLFILPVDFVILDYEADKSVPLIIGRVFLATVDAVIRVRDGKMSMVVDGQEAIFDVFKATKLPAHYEDLKMIIVVEPELTNAELDHFLDSRDPLETALVYGEDLMVDAEVEECLSILDTSCAYL